MTSELDWIFWTVGGLLGLGGLVLLLWSLFADRSKGRKRCPKCWYDMSHTPGLTCSECGYTIKREKKLHKTHRRWRWVVVAVVLLIGSASSTLTPKVKNDGWLSIVPTTVLILLATKDDIPSITGQTTVLFGQIINSGNPSTDLTKGNYKRSWRWRLTNKDNPSTELAKRIYENSLWPWQWRLLANQLHLENDASWIIDISAREQWPVGEPFYATIGISSLYQKPYWLNSSELRIKVKANLTGAITWSEEIHSGFVQIFGNARRTSGATTNKWTDPSHLVGIVPEGVQNVVFEVTLERRNSNSDNPWTTLWTEEFQQQLNVNGSIDEILKPTEGIQLKEALESYQFSVTQYGIKFNPKLSSSIDPWAFGTLALKFELLKNGTMIQETEAWWAMEDIVNEVVSNNYPINRLTPWDKLLPGDELFKHPDDNWSLRVSAVPHLALRNVPKDPALHQLRNNLGREDLVASGDYIPGEVTYKLRWIDDQQLWIVDD